MCASAGGRAPGEGYFAVATTRRTMLYRPLQKEYSMVHKNLTVEGILDLSRQRGLMAKRLYVMNTEPRGEPELLLGSLDAHFEYWANLGKKGIVLASGPFLPKDESRIGAGMVIFRAESLEEATQIAEHDPMHISGARRFTVTPWLLNQLDTEGLV